MSCRSLAERKLAKNLTVHNVRRSTACHRYIDDVCHDKVRSKSSPKHPHRQPQVMEVLSVFGGRQEEIGTDDSNTESLNELV